MTDRTLPATQLATPNSTAASHECVIRVFEPGHNRGDDLPADVAQRGSINPKANS